MKNSIKRIAEVAAVGAALTISTALSHGAALATVTYDWSFASSTTPAAPDGGGDAQALVAPGDLSDGWLASDAILGSAQGIWDLGEAGTVTLNKPSGFGGASGGTQLITVKVTQFQGGVYSQVGQVSVPGAELVSQGAQVGATGKMGVWVVQETDWQVPAGTAVNSIVFTAPFSRLLVDKVEVTTSVLSVQLPLLSITGVSGSRVMVSWPTASNSVVLESTTNLNDPQSWTVVTEPVQASGGTSSVTMSSIGPAKFYRLKKP